MNYKALLLTLLGMLFSELPLLSSDDKEKNNIVECEVEAGDERDVCVARVRAIYPVSFPLEKKVAALEGYVISINDEITSLNSGVSTLDGQVTTLNNPNSTLEKAD